MYRIFESSYCTLEANIVMYVNHTSMKKKKELPSTFHVPRSMLRAVGD